jgi:nucleoside-diphosphate-sugar epimerase
VGSPIRLQAATLAGSALRSDDRILVLGASGWLGQTCLGLLPKAASEQVMAIGSLSRNVKVEERLWPIMDWDAKAVEDFSPTVILNFAFLTREKEPLLGSTEYIRQNMELTSRFLSVAAGRQVRLALTTSSGAAVSRNFGESFKSLNTYGRLKASEEESLLELANAGRSIVIARAWSLSGTLVRRPRDYAFSDLIIRNFNHDALVRSASDVWRRYTLAEDFLAVAVASSLYAPVSTIDSGGDLIELKRLAAIIAGEAFAGVQHVSTELAGEILRLHYVSDNQSWTSACRTLRYEPAPLEEQVAHVASYFQQNHIA